MDIRLAYSCLLSRPWIHVAGAVPSSLHQKLKSIVSVISHILSTIQGLKMGTIEHTLDSCSRRSLILSTLKTQIHIGYIEAIEEAIEIAFQTLEIANTSLAKEVEDGNKLSLMRAVAKIMIRKGCRVGKGLGKRMDEITKPIQLRGNQGKQGLGY
ncbi:hypothetical protein CR513_19152, partial [Mucuna pruriens]